MINTHRLKLPLFQTCFHGSKDILDFSIFSSGGNLVYPSGMILAFLVGNYLGIIPMKFESHWPKGSGGVSF